MHALVAVYFFGTIVLGVAFPTRDSHGVFLWHGEGSSLQPFVTFEALMLDCLRFAFVRGRLWFANMASSTIIGVIQVHVVHGGQNWTQGTIPVAPSGYGKAVG